jgi:hypothetical protein
MLRGIAPWVVAALVLSAIALRLAEGLRRSLRLAHVKDDQESGASVVEFMLAFPLLLALILTILQIALIIQAKIVVNYAAFCSVRTAIVTIPSKIRSQRSGRFEDYNVIATNDPESPKMEIIRRAAALPCTAVSPLLSGAFWTFSGPNYEVIPALILVGAAFPATVDGKEVPLQLVQRGPYAYGRENTKVEVSGEGGGFHDHNLVTVKVTHRYYLAIPFANRLLGRSYPGLGFFGGAYYITIAEEYSLLNEGEPLFPKDQDIGESDIEVDRL